MRPGDGIEPATLRDLKIADKEGRLVPLVLNPVQRDLMEEFGLDPDDPAPSLDGKRLRKRILKARREGMSTIILALFFLDTYNNPNRRTISLAHDLESTQAIFEMVHRFFQGLPKAKQRSAKRSNRREMYWEDIDSRIFVATAGQENVGSGSTLHNIHKSERAKWHLSATQIRALDASLDEAGSHANIIEETTAYGMNHFFEDWQESVAGRSVYDAVFFPWFDYPDYRIPVPPDFRRTDEEEDRARAFGLDDEQLAWYRQKRRERKELTQQEYPHTPQEAFIASGTPYFDRDRLVEINNGLQGMPGAIEDLVLSSETLPRLRNAYRSGEFKVFKLPVVGRSYIVVGDTAEGLDPTRGDYDSAAVFDAVSWEEVATLDGKWDTDYYGRMLAELGWMYDTALLAIERNNHGHAVINAALNEGYPAQKGNGASGLYYHDPEIIEGKRSSKPLVRKAGWPTDTKTKNFALDKLASAIVEENMLFRSQDTVTQLMTYVHLGGGRSGGEGNAHDDRVIRSAIGAALLTLRFDPKRMAAVSNITPREPSTHYGSGNRR